MLRATPVICPFLCVCVSGVFLMFLCVLCCCAFVFWCFYAFVHFVVRLIYCTNKLENFFPEKNAPAKRLYEHAKKWVDLGYNVKVITGVPNAPKGVIYPGYKNKLYQKEIIDGIEVIRVWTFIAKYSGFMLRTFDFLSFMITSLFCGIFTRKIDIIISTTPQFLPVISGYILSKIKRVPFILELRDLWPESIVALNAMKKNNPIIKFLQNTTYLKFN